MDSALELRLRKISEQVDELKKAQESYLTLKANEKSLEGKLFLEAEGKTVSEKEAKSYSSADWKSFAKGLAVAQAEYEFHKRRYELLMKAFDAEYLSMKIDHLAITKGAS